MPDVEKLYTVDSKEEIRRLGKQGEPYLALRIYATAKDGTEFSVEVPEAELDSAHKVLEAKAKKILAI